MLKNLLSSARIYTNTEHTRRLYIHILVFICYCFRLRLFMSDHFRIAALTCTGVYLTDLLKGLNVECFTSSSNGFGARSPIYHMSHDAHYTSGDRHEEDSLKRV